MKNKKENIILNIIRPVLIMLWVYAAVTKVSNYPLFISELHKQPFPESTDAAIAIILPTIEIVTAVLLLFDRTLKTGYKGSFILMSLFTLYVLLAMTRTFGHIPCPCAGIIGRMNWGAHLVFNLFFVIISYVGYYLQTDKGNTTNERDKRDYSRITGKQPNARKQAGSIS